jgi:hypothetical protein
VKRFTKGIDNTEEESRMAKEKVQRINKELRKATLKACRSVEKMIREEPNPIVIGDGNNSESNGNCKEIAHWLFHRRHNDGGERNRTGN